MKEPRSGRVGIDVTNTSANEILSENHYYPFGMAYEGPVWINDASDIDNRYKYNGKEQLADHGLGWYNYGARFYDPSVGRFTGVDPFSGQFPNVSTYNFAENKPTTGIDLNGLQWVHYTQNNQEYIKVNVKVNYSGTAINQAQLNEYLLSVSDQFKQTIEMSTSGMVHGELTFGDPINDYQVQPTARILELSNETGVAAVTTNEIIIVSLLTSKGDLKSKSDFALDFVHELFHTIRLDHPFERTQSEDAALVRLDKNNFETVSSTDPSIFLNIMNYGSISINGFKLSDIWKYKKGDRLTPGQIQYLVRQIQRQMSGAGKNNKGDDYWDYWLEFPGFDVSIKNKE